MSALAALSPSLQAGLRACEAFARDSGSPLALFNIGTVHHRAGDPAAAETWFRAALARDPDLAEAHQNLAALLEDCGRLAEAHRHRDRAFRGRPLRIETAPEERRRVLLLCGGAYGNVPTANLLPRRTTTLIKLFVEYATEADWSALPAFDAVFNAIGDADLLPPGPWRGRLARTRMKVLNAPAQVALTRRDRLPRLLAGIPDLVVPRVQRRARGRRDPALRFPMLVRPVGAHGGHGVHLARSSAELGGDDAYVTEYHDYRSADGHFRKYRVIFVGGVPFPCHLAISTDWLVHYFSADMQAAPWKGAEEQRFLDAPAAVIGDRAMAALGAVGRRLGLAYGGIDFSLLPDGRVLVFEANATMTVSRDGSSEKQRVTTRIFEAFETLIAHDVQTSGLVEVPCLKYEGQSPPPYSWPSSSAPAPSRTTGT